jgi:E3 ubiquitin-protein ligase RNF13
MRYVGLRRLLDHDRGECNLPAARQAGSPSRFLGVSIMNIKNVTVRQAREKQGDGATYVDVRSVREFELGHPAGAVNVPLLEPNERTGQMQPNPEFLAVIQATFPSDAPLLLGCQAGMRSLQAAHVLAANGFSDLSNVMGGFGGGPDMRTGGMQEGWQQAGLPVEHGAPEGRGYADVRARAAGQQ